MMQITRNQGWKGLFRVVSMHQASQMIRLCFSTSLRSCTLETISDHELAAVGNPVVVRINYRKIFALFTRYTVS